eukprot:TRINITY_DN4388_c0_g2_i2.p1 TRINITY_DN4388_c0_g2~~TRINITY_DN4388_c0_g2_i2.p1  ORF type:complete len:1143 (-),score=205.30 TRINITY_DN4388_c0_g2_i2:336-3716(-)
MLTRTARPVKPPYHLKGGDIAEEVRSRLHAEAAASSGVAASDPTRSFHSSTIADTSFDLELSAAAFLTSSGSAAPLFTSPLPVNKPVAPPLAAKVPAPPFVPCPPNARPAPRGNAARAGNKPTVSKHVAEHTAGLQGFRQQLDAAKSEIIRDMADEIRDFCESEAGARRSLLSDERWVYGRIQEAHFWAIEDMLYPLRVDCVARAEHGATRLGEMEKQERDELLMRHTTELRNLAAQPIQRGWRCHAARGKHALRLQHQMERGLFVVDVLHDWLVACSEEQFVWVQLLEAALRARMEAEDIGQRRTVAHRAQNERDLMVNALCRQDTSTGEAAMRQSIVAAEMEARETITDKARQLRLFVYCMDAEDHHRDQFLEEERNSRLETYFVAWFERVHLVETRRRADITLQEKTDRGALFGNATLSAVATKEEKYRRFVSEEEEDSFHALRATFLKNSLAHSAGFIQRAWRSHCARKAALEQSATQEMALRATLQADYAVLSKAIQGAFAEADAFAREQLELLENEARGRVVSNWVEFPIELLPVVEASHRRILNTEAWPDMLVLGQRMRTEVFSALVADERSGRRHIYWELEAAIIETLSAAEQGLRTMLQSAQNVACEDLFVSFLEERGVAKARGRGLAVRPPVAPKPTNPPPRAISPVMQQPLRAPVTHVQRPATPAAELLQGQEATHRRFILEDEKDERRLMQRCWAHDVRIRRDLRRTAEDEELGRGGIEVDESAAREAMKAFEEELAQGIHAEVEKWRVQQRLNAHCKAETARRQEIDRDRQAEYQKLFYDFSDKGVTIASRPATCESNAARPAVPLATKQPGSSATTLPFATATDALMTDALDPPSELENSTHSANSSHYEGDTDGTNDHSPPKKSAVQTTTTSTESDIPEPEDIWQKLQHEEEAAEAEWERRFAQQQLLIAVARQTENLIRTEEVQRESIGDDAFAAFGGYMRLFYRMQVEANARQLLQSEDEARASLLDGEDRQFQFIRSRQAEQHRALQTTEEERAQLNADLQTAERTGRRGVEIAENENWLAILRFADASRAKMVAEIRRRQVYGRVSTRLTGITRCGSQQRKFTDEADGGNIGPAKGSGAGQTSRPGRPDPETGEQRKGGCVRSRVGL